MTDKQIIIDGVDVSGCEFFRVLLPSGCSGRYRCNCDSISTMSLNCEENNCIYKQLKAKEQECEELKEQFKLAEPLYQACNIKDKKIDQLKAEVKSKTEYIQEQRDIINQCSKEIEMYKKCQGKRASKREEQLKQTLAEIKEIAQYDVYTPHTDLCIKLNWVKKKISECEGNDEQ